MVVQSWLRDAVRWIAIVLGSFYERATGGLLLELGYKKIYTFSFLEFMESFQFICCGV